MATCERWREAASARRDGEDPGASVVALDDHLAHCAGCRRFAAGIAAVDQLARPAMADAPDRSAGIIAAVRAGQPTGAPRTPDSARRPVRIALGLVGLTQLVTALPSVFADAGAHSSRDLAAFQLALAVGFLVAAIHPVSAAGLLPTAGALVAVLSVVVVGDIAGGRVAAGTESIHLTEVVGVALLWLLPYDRKVATRPVPG